MVLWPKEETYSVVPESKVVEPNNPTVGQYVKVKDGRKYFLGEVVALGSKTEVETRMNEVESEEAVGDGGDKSSAPETNTTKGELSS